MGGLVLNVIWNVVISATRLYLHVTNTQANVIIALMVTGALTARANVLIAVKKNAIKQQATVKTVRVVFMERTAIRNVPITVI